MKYTWKGMEVRECSPVSPLGKTSNSSTDLSTLDLGRTVSSCTSYHTQTL